MGNSYSGQTGFSAAFEVLGDKTIEFFLFSSFYFVLHIIISSCFFTAVLPLIYFKNLSENNKKALLFLIIILLSSALVIAYTVFIREHDSQQESPRAMLRYVVFAPTILLIVFLSLFEKNIQSNKNNFLAYLFFVMLILIFYKIVEGTTIDSLILLPLIKDVVFTKENFYIFKIIFVCFSFFVFVIFYKNNKKGVVVSFLFIFSFYIVCNFILYQKFMEEYFVSDKEKEEAATIEKLIKDNSNKIFLIANRDWMDRKPVRLGDVFFNYPNVLSVYTNNISEMVSEEQSVLIRSIPLKKNWRENEPNYKSNDKSNYYDGIQKIDYFIFSKKSEYGMELENGDFVTPNFSVFAPRGAEHIQNFDGNIFVVFKNQIPEFLPFFVWIPDENVLFHGRR